MKTSSIALIFIFAASLWGSAYADGSFFEVELKRGAIYTPGDVNLTVKLTEIARFEGDYHFRVSVFAADVVVGEKVLEARRDEPSVFEMEFPAQRSRTDCRCRVELFMNKQFIESREIPLALWPRATAYADDFTDKTIWLHDTSGRLGEIFEHLKIETVDSDSQAALAFSKPGVVFFGEDTDATAMRRIWYGLEDIDPKPVIVLLRQKEFPEELGVVAESLDDSHRIDWVMSSPFLKGLAEYDLMRALRGIKGVRIVPRENELVIADPVLAGSDIDEGLLSYLARVERGDYTYVYCQLPIVADFSENPVSGALLRNLIEFACEEVSDKAPVIYRPLLEPEELEAEQLDGVFDKARGSAPEEGKIWFVRVLCNEAGRPDTFRAVVYFRPEYSSDRLRKGKFFCVDGLTMEAGGQGGIFDENPAEEAAVCQEYCQVSSSERSFAFELEVPGQDLLFPFCRGEDVSDEEVVGVVDYLRSIVKSGSSYSEFKGDAPIFVIEKKDGLIEVRAGVKDSARSGAGHILRIRSNDRKFELVNVLPW